MIRLLIVEPMPLVRAGVIACLSQEEDIHVLAGLDDTSQIVHISALLHPQVILLGALPGHDVYSVAAELHYKLPSCKVLIMTAIRNPYEVRRAAAAHAVGILVRDTAPESLADAIRCAATGTRVLDPDLAFAALIMDDNPLTPREVDALRCVAEGATSYEIAKSLSLTVGTVRNYVSRAIAKTGARNRVDAVRIAESSGWL